MNAPGHCFFYDRIGLLHLLYPEWLFSSGRGYKNALSLSKTGFYTPSRPEFYISKSI